MWKPEHRRAADRGGLRYPSDLTDAEWALIAASIPPARRGGRSATSMCAKLSTRSSMCFRQAASGRPCRRTCRRRARRISISCCGTGTARWNASTTRSMWRCAKRRPRSEPDGGDHRQPERQGSSKRGSSIDPQGFDAGKKVTGRKRHILVDTLGLLLSVCVLPANVQDRDGSRTRADRRMRRLFPFIERIFADAGYQGPKMAKSSPRPVAGRSRSSSAPICTASSSCRNDGSSSGPSPGSAATAVSRATSNVTPPPSPLSSASQ